MDINSYKEIFIEEARDNIKIFNSALLKFEKDITDLTPVNDIFRAVHTLKGMAATMGYDKMTEFTHSLEDILDNIRNGSIKVDAEITGLLFKGVDIIEKFLENISRNNIDITEGYEELINKYKEYTKTGLKISAKVIKEEQKKEEIPDLKIEEIILNEAFKRNLNVYIVKITLAEDCVFKNVRVFMVNRNLGEKGEIIKSSPVAKDLEEGKFGNSFSVAYITKLNSEEIEKLLYKIAEIKKVEVKQIKKGLDEKRKIEKKAENIISNVEKKKILSQSVRVNIEKLDVLLNLVGELVIAKIRLEQISKDKQFEILKETANEFDRIINELQAEVTQVRMLPVNNIFDRFPRITRDLAVEEGKEIETEIIGGDIEIDRTVLEEINEPLLHLVRNSVAHGIEKPEERISKGKSRKGIIRLSAKRERNSVIIEISDDGKGIDVLKVKKKALEMKILSEEKIKNITDEEIVNIIALPGFSTMDTVDKIAGRGVGVDVVKTKIESLGGIFKIENYPGEGVKFIMKLPLTLAIIQALLVKTSQNIYALPVIYTLEILELNTKSIKLIQGKRVIVLRDEVIAVFSLAELLKKKREEKEVVQLVIVEVRDKKIALEVDEVIGQQEIAIKSLGEFLKYAKGFSGVTILGDGRISLILDIQSLLEENNNL